MRPAARGMPLWNAMRCEMGTPLFERGARAHTHNVDMGWSFWFLGAEMGSALHLQCGRAPRGFCLFDIYFSVRWFGVGFGGSTYVHSLML